MTTFNTRNALGSKDPKDLYDNAQNLDEGINGTAKTWTDRLGVTRKSWTGIETDFQQFIADGSTITFPTWSAASAAAAAAQIPLNRQVTVVGDSGTHVDPVSGLTVPNSGRYVMVASGLQWLSADVISQKADRTQVDPISAWKASAQPAIDPLLAQTFVGYPSVPVTGDSAASGYTFVLPQQATAGGAVDQVEVFGGSVSGAVVIKAFAVSGTVLTEVGRTTVQVSAGQLNTIPVDLAVPAGGYVGFFFAATSVAYTGSTAAARRAYRASGDAATVDMASAPRLVEIMARVRIRSAEYTQQDIAAAVEAGDLTVGAFDGYSIATRRPLILDLDGTLGIADSLYVPRDLWVSRGAVVGVTASNAVVTNVAGGYTRVALSPGSGTWDTGFINTVYFDPIDGLIKILTGTAAPPDRLLTKVLTIFQITGRNGGWRSASGLLVDVRSRPRGQAVLTDLYDAVINPLRDCRVVLLGDSITWGMTANGIGPTEPRGHALTDVRDNFASGSWANRLRRWMSKLAVNQQNETSPAAGQSIHSGQVQFTPRYDERFQAIRSDGIVPRDGGGTNSGALLKRYLDSPASPMVAEGRIVFRYVGADISIVHAALDGGEYEFWVDGVLKTTFVYAPPVRFGAVTDLTGIAFGSHDVEIISKGTQLFRLEAVRRAKVVSFANNGLIGTNTSEWLPSGSLLAGGVPADSTHVVIQLGTNDRDMAAGASYPAGAAGTYQNLIDIVTWLRTNRPLANVVLMAPPYTPADGPQGSSGEIAVAVRRAATVLGTGFIDNWGATYELAMGGETWLADGIHPNNAGHRSMFQNILRAITAGARPG